MFFREFVDALGLSSRIDVRTFGSIESLQTWLELFSGKATFREKVASLAVIRDAESSPAEDAFKSVCAALTAASLPTPLKLNAYTPAPLRVGVYILPDCVLAGMLETLCLESAAEVEATSQTKLLLCVDEFIRCIDPTTSFPNPTKVRLAGYVLARGAVDTQLGRAAQQKIIEFSAPAFRPLSEFLKVLAG